VLPYKTLQPALYRIKRAPKMKFVPEFLYSFLKPQKECIYNTSLTKTPETRHFSIIQAFYKNQFTPLNIHYVIDVAIFLLALTTGPNYLQ